jgi:hypothetical protein
MKSHACEAIEWLKDMRQSECMTNVIRKNYLVTTDITPCGCAVKTVCLDHQVDLLHALIITVCATCD